MREMKDSGIPWLGEIDKRINMTPIKYLLESGKNSIKVGPFGSQLSGNDFQVDDTDYWVYNQRSVIDRNAEYGTAFITEEKYNNMQGFHVKENDILITTRGTIGKIFRVPNNHNKGIIHPCLIKFRLNEEMYDYDLLEMMFNESDLITRQIFYGSNATTIEVIYSETLKNIKVPMWPMKIQRVLSMFLKEKCTEIDALSADVQAEIETLEKYKQSVINEAVTKGLDKHVVMKDSGTPWCPKVPVHWEKVNPKALFSQRLDRANLGERQLTASQEYGIVYQDEFMEMTGNRVVTVIKDFSILKHVEPGDFVISMRSFQGGLEYSEKRGCISSAYVMLIPNRKLVYPPFYRWFFKSSKYINAIQSTSNLVRDGQAMRYANFVQVPLFKIPLKEQQEIAEYLNDKVANIEAVTKVKQEQLTVLDEYKKSLIFEYVTGKKEVPLNG